MTGETPYIRSAKLLKEQFPTEDRYPFQLPFIRNLDELELHPKVTFFTGENGMGKSTLLEAIAVAAGFNPEGGSMNFDFSTRDSHSVLDRYIRLVRSATRPGDGFFLRAESYYNVATHIEELDSEPGGGRVIDGYGGVSLHEQSHGESFFSTFMNRFRGRGIYIMDEPEAALSPLRQLSMLARIEELVQDDSQFIIATHSPLLMAYPDAVIYEFTDEGVRPADLEDTHHYRLMKQFFDDRERMLYHLLRQE